MHAQAKPAAEAAQCAMAQGKFWDYHDKLFANQKALAPENLKQYATDVGLDVEDFDACLSGGQTRNDVDTDHQQGQRLGVTGTPAFFINGRFLSGAQPFDAFKSIIDEELEN